MFKWLAKLPKGQRFIVIALGVAVGLPVLGTLLLICFALVVIGISKFTGPLDQIGNKPPDRPAQYVGPEYPADWDTGSNPPVLRVLVKYNISGCAEVRWKKSKVVENYLVQCSVDGENWKTYTVWTGIEKLIETPEKAQ